MIWIDIACIVFVCVTANHLGLVKAVEEVTESELHIVNCPKCLTWWTVFVYTTFMLHDFVTVLAISFLCSYLALWLELAEGYVDILYMKLYEKVYSDTTYYTPAEDDDTAGTLSGL